jgi:NDP-sugar pyrophosphorylase family protein
MSGLAGIDVVLLAGGKGTRLAGALPGLPKALAPVAGRPLLFYQLDRLARQGAKRVILSLGYMADAVILAMGGYANPSLAVAWTIETEPRDTGGGLVQALPLLRSDPVMAMNADSLVGADLASFLDFHQRKRAKASLIAAEMEDASRYGRLRLDGEDRILAFLEKQPGGAGVINAGVYLLERPLIEAMPKDQPVSLERDLFPALCGEDFFAFRGRFPFLDIGTPESYAGAADFLAALSTS